MKNFILSIGCILLFVGTACCQWGAVVPAPAAVARADFHELGYLANVRIDKRYATSNNICGVPIDSSRSCCLRGIAFEKFLRAGDLLRREHPGWTFVVFDAYRPPSVQEKLWQHVKGTPQARYVAYPKCISLHSLGLAVDLTLADEHGNALDMGTDFDAFTQAAAPRFEQESLRAKLITEAQLENRLLLRRIMQRAGFIQLQSEWWHFEALHELDAHAHYSLVE